MRKVVENGYESERDRERGMASERERESVKTRERELAILNRDPKP